MTDEHPLVNELADFILLNASWDGTPEKECPHCGGVLEAKVYQLDKLHELSSAIIDFLGIPAPQGSTVREIIGQRIRAEVEWIRLTSKDDVAHVAAQDVLMELYGNKRSA